MLWRGDREGRCVYLSCAMRAFWGLRQDDVEGFTWASSLLEEDAGAVFGPFAEGMASQTAFTCEARYRRADGEIRTLRTRAQPYHDAAGQFAGMIGVNEDITELREVQRALETGHRELAANVELLSAVTARLDLAIRISGLAMSEHDEDLRYTWCQNLPGDCLGKTPTEFLGVDVGAALEGMLGRALRADVPLSEEIAIVMGGQPFWFDIQAGPAVLADGRRGVVASALDVTARKLNEDKLKVLAREMSHRVKNVFAVVQAMVRKSAQGADVPAGFLDALEARLAALAKAQESLFGMSDDRFSLRDLLARQLSHLDGIRLCDAEDVLVPGKLGPYIALAVHELGTNALKYGSLSVADGHVELLWEPAGLDVVTVSWRERGGPCCATASGPGFGSTLLTRVFGAATGGATTLSIEPEGLHWTATFSVRPELSMPVAE